MRCFETSEAALRQKGRSAFELGGWLLVEGHSKSPQRATRRGVRRVGFTSTYPLLSVQGFFSPSWAGRVCVVSNVRWEISKMLPILSVLTNTIVPVLCRSTFTSPLCRSEDGFIIVLLALETCAMSVSNLRDTQSAFGPIGTCVMCLNTIVPEYTRFVIPVPCLRCVPCSSPRCPSRRT